ncbi:hypothetical protein WH87_09635 [Devosia epidermidihirudinis]|uniref:Outer membrane protein beta-barrel domain-containing protein n=1 Tax=Devosia epidermidihirudinis TaxID=1293439 RepID=A0A0F5QAC2_9HYPH|nr:outer membrane protein [Devosia epidermidihirudinis]KKC37915.1 hypothetical protein WH87_09635 [Devosia epidermidihirudinis]
MQKFLLVAALLAGATSSVAAADIYVAPAAAADQYVYDWSGAYAGAFLGYGWGASDFTDVDGYNLGGEVFGVNSRGALAGLTLGYNAQHGAFVLGVEGEVSYLGLDGTTPQPDSPIDTLASINGGLYASLAGRLGVTADKALIYAKAGLALTGAKGRVDDNCDVGACGGGLINATTGGLLVGYTLGAGVEYAFSEQWSAKLEYSYLNFGSATASGVYNGSDWNYDYDLSAHTVKVGLNYKF